ncbi:MAG: GDSL family lipase [Oscillospiraceae bacterium]|nr:GDSL family lipase [Oscillospiraceae bacterium]
MKTFVFQGDSITDCGRSRSNDINRGDGYPTLAAASIGYKYPGEFSFLNRGISGDRIVDLNARIKRDIINLSPDYLSILIGINDVWHEIGSRNGVSNSKYYKTYCDMIEEILVMCPGIKIFILEPFVLKASATKDNWGIFCRETRMRAESARAVAEKYGLYFVPLQEKFDKLCEKAPADYWLYDGVHPSAMGHQMIAESLENAVIKTL